MRGTGKVKEVDCSLTNTLYKTDRASVLCDLVAEAAVALGSQADVVGSLQQQGLLQVAGGLVHVGDAVLAVVGDALVASLGQQADEVQLDVHAFRI